MSRDTQLPSQSLIIIPCGRRKLWDKHPDAGPTPAHAAYTSPTFRRNRLYAERFAPTSWLILSAKYGLIPPNFPILAPYNVTFKDRTTNPITVDTLHDQIRKNNLDTYPQVIALGSNAYRAIVEQAFAPFSIPVHTPFAGLSIGYYLQAVKRATESGIPFPLTGPE